MADTYIVTDGINRKEHIYNIVICLFIMVCDTRVHQIQTKNNLYLWATAHKQTTIFAANKNASVEAFSPLA